MGGSGINKQRVKIRAYASRKRKAWRQVERSKQSEAS
jgi:hypothetical protein